LAGGSENQCQQEFEPAREYAAEDGSHANAVAFATFDSIVPPFARKLDEVSAGHDYDAGRVSQC
jgi:hypothetical protein